MKTESQQEKSRTQVFNVVILDRSGSMECIRRAAVDSFNETLAGIRKAQKEYAATQDHFVSLVTFCSCSMKQVFDKVPIAEVKPLKLEDYQPCCRTPLYDAMGFTITGLRDYVRKIEDAVVVVTIITDGLENASKEYTGRSIKTLVESLREEGWTFTYMGANQDAEKVAMDLSIRNSRNFEYSEEGIEQCMERSTNTRMRFYSRLNTSKENTGERLSKLAMSEMADEAFDEEEKK